MKKCLKQGLILSLAFVFLLVTEGFSQNINEMGFPMGHPNNDRPIVLKGGISSFQQVPSFSSGGQGHFKAEVNAERTEVKYKLSYGGMEGDVFMAHIHFAQAGANGGIMVWFCGDPDAGFPPPASINVPLCGPQEDKLEGTFTADELLGPEGQGISAGEFEAFVVALEKGLGYVNIHSTLQPPGEIRGQIHRQRFGWGGRGNQFGG